MGSDLFQREAMEHLGTLSPVDDVPAGVWDGFARGTGLATMKGLAKTGRAIDLLGSVPPVIGDTLSGGTEMQDRYFKEHDDVFNSAVDFWTPKPNEVGIAGEVTGQLLSLLPQVITSPALAVGATQLGEGEDLVRKGVDSGSAGKVAALQATGLGLGIWMPVLGSTLAQRVLLGGAAFNTAQGIVTRGASGAVLAGTPAAEDYKAFDPQSLTLDVLLGVAFGSLAHLSPEQRTHGAETWKRIEEWAKDIKPSEIDALATLREAQHMNADSLPGKPSDVADIGLHVDRMRAAIDQVLKDKPVQLSDLPEPKLTPDPAREAQMKSNADELVKEAERVRVEEGLQEPSLIHETPLSPVETAPTPPPGAESPATTGATFYHGTRSSFTEFDPTKSKDGMVHLTTDQVVAKTMGGPGSKIFGVDVPEASKLKLLDRGNAQQEQALLSGYQEAGGIKEWLIENGYDGFKSFDGDSIALVDASKAKIAAAEQVEKRAELDPVAMAADRFATENPDHLIRTGTDAEGKPLTKTPKEFLTEARDIALRAQEDAKLYQIAAECLLGG